jgi:hypothetical protein
MEVEEEEEEEAFDSEMRATILQDCGRKTNTPLLL